MQPLKPQQRSGIRERNWNAVQRPSSCNRGPAFCQNKHPLPWCWGFCFPGSAGSIQERSFTHREHRKRGKKRTDSGSWGGLLIMQHPPVPAALLRAQAVQQGCRATRRPCPWCSSNPYAAPGDGMEPPLQPRRPMQAVQAAKAGAERLPWQAAEPELQIHNSSGTPRLFASCCEQMEELQIKPSAAREPLAFPAQRRVGRGRKHKIIRGEKKTKAEKGEGERERKEMAGHLCGLSCHLAHLHREHRSRAGVTLALPGGAER